VRRGAGDDALILGCGCPLGPAVGLVDLMRIGPDVTPRWRNPMRWALRDRNCLSTLHAIRNTIHRAFLHRTWWINDPDCVLARAKKNKLTLDEVRTFASLAATSGGMFLLSDDMTEYPDERLALVKTALSCRTREMVVLDPQAGEFPTRMAALTNDGCQVLQINFGRRPSAPILDLREFMSLDELARVEEVTEVWERRTLVHQDGLIRLGAIPPHGCRLLRIRVRGNGG
jgi:alpha-galactosidase